MIGFGNIARAELYKCSEGEQKYLLYTGVHTNPGNSGGPLFNLETDKVVGMTTAFLGAQANNSGISCAIPASVLIKFLEENLPPRTK